MEKDKTLYPRLTIHPSKSFTKATSLVFLLHHYGQTLGDARYKTERILAGESINATLPLVENIEDVYSDLKKIGLRGELQNKSN